jgi:hypothetical protein
MHTAAAALATQNLEALAAEASSLSDEALDFTCDELLNNQLLLNRDATAALLADDAALTHRLLAAGSALNNERLARR